jgi:hypothetical protein
MPRITDEQVRELERRYPKVGNLTADDLDDEFVAGVVRELVVSVLRERHPGKTHRGGGRRAPTDRIAPWPAWAEPCEIREVTLDVWAGLKR